jgi:hypothetical protein
MTTRIAPRLLIVALLAACGGDPPAFLPASPPRPGPSPSLELPSEGSFVEQSLDRQVIARASMQMFVEEPVAAAGRVEALVGEASGYIENSEASSDSRVQMDLRVPATSLDAVRSGIRALGEVDRERASSSDVTRRMNDMGARIDNLVAVRDRLRGYLDRATTIEEIIRVESEITRVQTEIDSLTTELNRMRSQVAMSQLSVSLGRKRTLGPVAQVGRGLGWFFKKLIIWE